MESALERIDAIVDWLTEGTPVFLLDFDGTLAPIVDEPGEAYPSESMRRVVRRLAARWPVAVVSGRELVDVRERVGLAEIAYAGSHGFEIQRAADASVSFDRAEEHLERVDRAEKRLGEEVGDGEGVQMERKRYGIAVHYRKADRAMAERTRSKVDEILEETQGLEATRGKAVIDVRPAIPWDKGDAVEWLLERLDVGRARPLFIGDDTTDEDAFEALRDDGLGIRVGADDGSTAARFGLEDVGRVEAFLGDLADRL